ncbi:MAG: DUF1361 domain-containing protein [Patescibacteria group bacterium]
MKLGPLYIPKQILILLLLAVILNLARVAIFDSLYFIYLLWNIFLAILPFIASSLLLNYFNNKRLTKITFTIGFVAWLLLLPNAPYIVTDMIHLGRGRSAILLYDTFLLFSSAWAGLLLGIYSISHIEKIIKSKYSSKVTSILVGFIILLTSFGVYLGRFLRFNSWDVISDTSFLFKNLWSVVSNPNEYIDAYLFTGLTFLFIFVSYRAWKYTQIEPKSNI